VSATVDRLIGLAWGLASVGAFVGSIAASDKDQDRLLAAGFATAVLSVLFRILAELESDGAER
jgi:hypothetical protein